MSVFIARTQVETVTPRDDEEHGVAEEVPGCASSPVVRLDVKLGELSCVRRLLGEEV